MIEEWRNDPARLAAVSALVEKTIGCAMRVHSALGPGFLESVYQSAFAIEIETSGIPYLRELAMKVAYRDRPVGEHRLDFLIDDTLVVETKAVELLNKLHSTQLISYLKASSLPVGLIVNFNVPHLRDGLRRLRHPQLYDDSTSSSPSPSSC